MTRRRILALDRLPDPADAANVLWLRDLDIGGGAGGVREPHRHDYYELVRIRSPTTTTRRTTRTRFGCRRQRCRGRSRRSRAAERRSWSRTEWTIGCATESSPRPLALLELPRGRNPAELAGGFGLPRVGPLSARIEQSFARRVVRMPEATQRVLLIAAAEPIGDPTLIVQAADRMGPGHR